MRLIAVSAVGAVVVVVDDDLHIQRTVWSFN